MNPDFIDELAPELRPLLLVPKEEREQLLEQTRKYLDSSGFTNPINWLYSKVERPEIIDRAPTFEGLRDEDAAAFRRMGFVPLQVLKAAGSEFECWAGPDGAISLEVLGKKYFMSVLFDDGYKIAVVLDDAIGRKIAAKNPNSGYLYSSSDPQDDYVTLLEQMHAYMTRVGANPLYRFDSKEMDLALYNHYLRHFATLATIKTSIGAKAFDMFLGEMGVDAAAEELAGMAKEARRQAFDGRSTSKIDSTGVVVACPECGQSNRVPFERLADKATCAACKHGFESTAQLATFDTCDAFEELLRGCPLPVVVGFCYPLGDDLAERVEALDAAAKWSNGAALVVFGDLSHEEGSLAAVKFGVSEAALVRVKGSTYGQAEVRHGSWTRKAAVSFVAR